jgi:hypothetical protein
MASNDHSEEDAFGAPPRGDKRVFIVAMGDESGATVFRAAVSFMAEWLTEPTA